MIAPCYLMIPMYSGIWQNYTTLLTQYLTKVILGTLAVSVTRHSWSDSLISNNNPVKSWSTIYPKYFQQQKRFNNSLGIDKSVLSAQKHLFWNYFNFYIRTKIKIFEILFHTKMFMRVTIVCGEIFLCLHWLLWQWSWHWHWTPGPEHPATRDHPPHYNSPRSDPLHHLQSSNNILILFIITCMLLSSRQKVKII